ncbi:MAG: preprotein translocase subunit SecG [Planctomycetia bacterium]|jgi:preprotein translocase subunit SecG
MLSLVRFLLGLGLVLTSLFLIFLVLIQRGRGGGLAGAFGGAGGQSAFGTKAGDVFTKITVGVAAFWIVLCVLSVNILGRQQSLLSGNLGSAAPEAVGPSAGAAPGSQPAAETTPAETKPASTPAATAAEGTAAPATPAAPTTPAAPATPTPPAAPADAGLSLPSAGGAAPAPAADAPAK